MGFFFSLKICFVLWLHLWSNPWSDPRSDPIQILSTLLEGRVVSGTQDYITGAWDEILTSSPSSERNCLDQWEDKTENHWKIQFKASSRPFERVELPWVCWFNKWLRRVQAEGPAYSHLTFISMASEGDVEKGKQDNADENVSSIASLVVILRNATVTNVCSPSS